MTPIRKEFFMRIILIGLGVIPIIILYKNHGPARFIALAGFLFSIYNFIAIIKKLQLIFDDFNPPKYKTKTQESIFEKTIYYAAGSSFFGGLFFEIFEIKNIDNTINGLRFFWTYAFIGLMLFIFITILLKLFKPSVYYESNRRLSVHLGFLIGLFLLIPALASFINHEFGDENIKIEEYKICEKGSSPTKNKEYYLYLDVNGDEQRVTVQKSFWEGVKDQQIIVLCTKRGILGYEYIVDFEKRK